MFLPRRFLQWILGRGREDAETPAARRTGDEGERAAEDFLKRERSLRVLARNWRSGRDEIDLICQDGPALVFVEVKTRAAGGLVPGYYAVDQRKKTALLRATRAYMKRLKPRPATFRFDIVVVNREPGGSQTIEHFENVPLFPKRFMG